MSFQVEIASVFRLIVPNAKLASGGVLLQCADHVSTHMIVAKLLAEENVVPKQTTPCPCKFLSTEQVMGQDMEVDVRNLDIVTRPAILGTPTWVGDHVLNE